MLLAPGTAPAAGSRETGPRTTQLPETELRETGKKPLPLPPKRASTERGYASPDVLGGALRGYGQLTLLLGGFASALAVWRRFARPGHTFPRSADPVEELGSLELLDGNSARMVRCGPSIVVLLDTPQGVLKLKEIDDRRTVAEILRRFGTGMDG